MESQLVSHLQNLPGGPEVFLKLLLVFFLVLLNGFFVAAEFAIVKVRASQIDSLLKKKDPRAHLVQSIIHHLNAYLSATQLGITLTSLGLGWVGEPFVAKLLFPVFKTIGIESNALIQSLSFGVGFGIITFLHIILGELAPKSIAIQYSQKTALHVAHPLYFFYRAFFPVIWLLDWMTVTLFRWLHIPAATESELIHSEEELRILLGNIKKDERSISRNIQVNAFTLKTLRARNIMLPRPRIVALREEFPFEENLKIALESRHTRFPLCRKDMDHVVGMVHLKDLFGQLQSKFQPSLRELVKREILFVPEFVTLETLLTTFLETKCHMAIVVDEFGGTLGMVTLEDVLEEVVGEIQDEFDHEQPLLREVGVQDYLVDGSMPLHDVEEKIGLHFPLHQDATTLGGYLTDLNQNIPPVDSRWEMDGWEYRVEKIEKFRIAQVRIRKLSEEAKMNIPSVEDA